jgi:zinc protease
LDGILQERANPNATAGRVVRKVLFGALHPYGWPVAGSEASVQSFERSDLLAFYRTHYSPVDACLIMVGDVNMGNARELAEKAFSTWKAKASPAVHVEPVGCSGRRAYLVDRPRAPQSEVRLALPAPERSTSDYFSLQVLNNVLGGGFSSRLNLNLREKKGYSYGAFSALRFGRFQSLFLGIAPVETGVTKDAVQEMLNEFEAMSSWKRPVAEQELEDAKATLIRGYAQRYETLAQVAGEIAELEGFGLSMEELAGYTSQIEAVSLDHLEAAAGKYIPTEDFVLVVVGDLQQVEPGIRSLELDEVIRVDVDGDPV